MKTLLRDAAISAAVVVVIVLAVLLVALPARAGSCNVVYPHAVQSYANVKAAVQDYHDVKRITVLEYVPLYFVGNAAPAAPVAAAPAESASSPCDAKVSALEAKLAVLEAKFAAQPPPEKSVPVTPEPLTAPKSAVAQKCAACHDQGVAAAKGKNLSLTANGKMLKWSAETTGKVVKRLSDGTMPPPPAKLTQEEFAALVQDIFDAHSK